MEGNVLWRHESPQYKEAVSQLFQSLISDKLKTRDAQIQTARAAEAAAPKKLIKKSAKEVTRALGLNKAGIPRLKDLYRLVGDGHLVLSDGDFHRIARGIPVGEKLGDPSISKAMHQSMIKLGLGDWSQVSGQMDVAVLYHALQSVREIKDPVAFANLWESAKLMVAASVSRADPVRQSQYFNAISKLFDHVIQEKLKTFSKVPAPEARPPLLALPENTVPQTKKRTRHFDPQVKEVMADLDRKGGTPSERVDEMLRFVKILPPELSDADFKVLLDSIPLGGGRDHTGGGNSLREELVRRGIMKDDYIARDATADVSVVYEALKRVTHVEDPREFRALLPRLKAIVDASIEKRPEFHAQVLTLFERMLKEKGGVQASEPGNQIAIRPQAPLARVEVAPITKDQARLNWIVSSVKDKKDQLSSFRKLIKEKGSVSEKEFYTILEKLPRGADWGDKHAWQEMERAMVKQGYGPYSSGSFETVDVPILFESLSKLGKVSDPDKLRRSLPNIYKILEESRTFAKISEKDKYDLKEFFFRLTEEKIPGFADVPDEVAPKPPTKNQARLECTPSAGGISGQYHDRLKALFL
jgi:hypothetical protein